MHNNLCDLRYDRLDSAKKHFPLVTGEIKESTAWQIDLVAYATVILMGAWLSQLKGYAVAFLVVTLFFAWLYNWACKKTVIAPIFIMLSYSTLPMLSYFSVAESMSLLMGLVLAYALTLMLFQISYEGYMKDIEQTKEVNLLRRMGAKVKKGVFYPTWKTQAFGWGFRLPTIIIGIAIIKLYTFDLWAAIGFAFLNAIVLGFSHQLIKQRKFNRTQTVRHCAIVEMLVYFSLPFALAGTLGLLGVAIMVLYPLLYFMLLNKLTWGTILRPKV